MTNRNPYEHLEITSLPRLPVPNLDHTAQMYLDLLEPLLSPKHFEKASELVRNFMNGEAKNLDKDLRELAAIAPTSWLEGFWETMYLAYRGEPMINVNPCFTFSPTPDMSQLGRGSEFIEAVVIFLKLLQQNKIPMDKERDANLCMTQYGRVFATTRIPVAGRDKIVTFTDSRHIVVLCRRKFYRLNVLTDDNKIIPASVIREGLRYIYDSTPEIQRSGELIEQEISDGIAEGGLSILTGTDRDVWASFRSQLIANPHNRKLIQEIDSAILVFVLDDNQPQNPEEIVNQFLHGFDGTNRWFDRLQLIAAPNGELAWNMEHAPFDGHTLLSISGYLWDHVRNAKRFNTESLSFAPSTGGAAVSQNMLQLQSMDFKISKAQRSKMVTVWENIKSFIHSTELSVLRFDEFGADYIKKQGLSPDAFVQMAYQLAYFKLHHKVASTYESCMTKRFYHGRTECVRSVSKDSKRMCEELTSPHSVSLSPLQKFQLIKQATEKHVQTMNECKVANGVDRHLWGMYNMAIQKRDKIAFYDIPEIFTDPSFPTFCTSVISTSNCGGNAFQLFAFGPVTGNGLGLGYMIKNNLIDICISSFIGEASAFRAYLLESLHEMRSICDAFHSSSPKARL